MTQKIDWTDAQKIVYRPQQKTEFQSLLMKSKTKMTNYDLKWSRIVQNYLKIAPKYITPFKNNKNCPKKQYFFIILPSPNLKMSYADQKNHKMLK